MGFVRGESVEVSSREGLATALRDVRPAPHSGPALGGEGYCVPNVEWRVWRTPVLPEAILVGALPAIL
jgi:hypothetical protein